MIFYMIWQHHILKHGIYQQEAIEITLNKCVIYYEETNLSQLNVTQLDWFGFV